MSWPPSHLVHCDKWNHFCLNQFWAFGDNPRPSRPGCVKWGYCCPNGCECWPFAATTPACVEEIWRPAFPWKSTKIRSSCRFVEARSFPIWVDLDISRQLIKYYIVGNIFFAVSAALYTGAGSKHFEFFNNDIHVFSHTVYSLIRIDLQWQPIKFIWSAALWSN